MAVVGGAVRAGSEQEYKADQHCSGRTQEPDLGGGEGAARHVFSFRRVTNRG